MFLYFLPIYFVVLCFFLNFCHEKYIPAAAQQRLCRVHCACFWCHLSIFEWQAECCNKGESESESRVLQQGWKWEWDINTNEWQIALIIKLYKPHGGLRSLKTQFIALNSLLLHRIAATHIYQIVWNSCIFHQSFIVASFSTDLFIIHSLSKIINTRIESFIYVPP